MNNKKTLKNIAFITFSNVLKLISSILIGFVIPKILGVTDFGYYKIFILYMTYIGLFHFGFIDGIYLKFGGSNYEDLSKQKFRSYFRFLLYLELLIVFIGIIFSIVFLQGEREFIFIMLFINLLAINMTTYFQFISQITSRFKEYSSRIIILSITNIIIVIILYVFNLNDYRIYTQLIVITNFLLLIWYIYTYKDIVFGSSNSIRDEKYNIKDFFKYGVILLLANLSTTLVLTVNKQIVEIFFSVDDFGIYSFAYSMLAIITVVVSAVSVVLYPTFKKIDFEKLIIQYDKLNRFIILTVTIGLIGYFPLLWIVPKFLPEYIDSLIIFRVAIPGLLFSSSISAIKHNYFKVANKNNHYFYISLVVIIFNIILSLGVYYIYKTLVSIALSSILGLLVWYIATEIYMIKNYNVRWKTNFLLITFSIMSFYLITSLNNFIIAGLLFLLVSLLLVAITYGKNIFDFVYEYRNNKKQKNKF